METLLYWDERLFFWIFEGLRADWLTPVMVFFSDALKALPARLLVLGIWVGMLIRGGRLRTYALLLVPVLVMANETSDFLKAYVGRERPCVALPIEPITGVLTSGSFPSAHAANMASVVGLAVGVGGKRMLLWWSWLPLVVGLSRVYVGVHYPLDVVGGWVIGGLYGFGVGWLWGAMTAWWKGRAVPSAESEEPEASGVRRGV